MKLNNKGFTLIEVIISMAIMTSIIFIGYQVINKTDSLRKDQMIVSNIQNGANNLKRYISKDLKESNSVYIKYGEKNIDLNQSEKVNNLYKTIQNEINEKNHTEYEYLININEKKIYYIVKVIKVENKKLYSIYREEKVNFSLIENQPLSHNIIPLKITEKDGLYDVQLNYIKDNTKVFSFDVYNLLVAYNDEDKHKPTNPEVPDIGVSSQSKGYFAYCINNSINNISNLNIRDKNLENVLSKLEGLLNLDIRKDNLEDKIEHKIEDIHTDISNFYKDPYKKFDRDDCERIYKALGYIYVAKEVADEIDDKDGNLVNIIKNVKDGLYGEKKDGSNGEKNEKFENCYIKLTNKIFSYLYGDANNNEIAKMQNLSDNVKNELNKFRDYNTEKASEIYNDTHGVNPNLDKLKEICDESNSMIDNTINNIVYIKSTVRWDLLRKENYKDVEKTKNYVVKIEKDLIEKLVKVKSLAYDANYYNGEI